MRYLFLVVGLALTATPMGAAAQSAGALEQQWRAAKRAELMADRARIDAQVAAIDGGATPDTIAGAAPVPISALAPAAPLAGPPAPAAGTTAAPASTALNDVVKDPANATQGFGGIEFGVGVSYTADVGDRDRIGEAQVVGGVVRVSDENNGRARIMLESHYFFTPCGRFLRASGLATNPCKWVDGEGWERDTPLWGWGPFVALQPGGGDDNIIDAIGMGLMVGFRKSEATTQSFNIGVGIVIDPNTRVLGDGLTAGQPLPAGETEIRYKETAQTGFLLLASFSF